MGPLKYQSLNTINSSYTYQILTVLVCYNKRERKPCQTWQCHVGQLALKWTFKI